MSKALAHNAGVKTAPCIFVQTANPVSAELAPKPHRVRLSRLSSGLDGGLPGGQTGRWRCPTGNLAGPAGRRDWRDWEEPWWVTWLGCLTAAGLLALSLLLL
jgi:hypothetical protein